ncbi:MAG: hypothetical protein M0Z87_12160 [Actinomycetota bacterium]|nr:hypothetical protein [Actinomycetota bacterium]
MPNVGRHAAAGPGGAFFLVEGIALSALLVLATASGRREAFAAALLLIAAGPWGPEALFQVLFLAAALWQGYVSLAARRQRDQRDRPTRGTGVSDRS